MRLSRKTVLYYLAALLHLFQQRCVVACAAGLLVVLGLAQPSPAPRQRLPFEPNISATTTRITIQEGAFQLQSSTL